MDKSKDSIFIHPTAEVQSTQIGLGSTIWQFVVILQNAQIGSNCNINAQVFIENDVLIGNDVTVKSGVQLWDGVRLKDKVFVGPNATFTNDLIPRSKQYPEFFPKTIVEEGASIGANSTILAGLTIGKFAMIGAGSVLTKNAPAFSLWYGNPAKQQGFVTREGTILDMNLVSSDGIQYSFEGNEPVKM